MKTSLKMNLSTLTYHSDPELQFHSAIDRIGISLHYKAKPFTFNPVNCPISLESTHVHTHTDSLTFTYNVAIGVYYSFLKLYLFLSLLSISVYKHKYDVYTYI